MRHKLKRVLWIPVEGERSIPLAKRRVGSSLLWSPNEEEDRQLREDWEELMDMIVLWSLSGSPLVTGNIYRYDRKQRMRKR